MKTSPEMRTRDRHADNETRELKHPHTVLHRSTLTLGQEGLARYVANRTTGDAYRRSRFPHPSNKVVATSAT